MEVGCTFYFCFQLLLLGNKNVSLFDVETSSYDPCPNKETQMSTMSEVLAIYEVPYLYYKAGLKYPHRFLIYYNLVHPGVGLLTVYEKLGDRFLFSLEPFPQNTTMPLRVTHSMCIFRRQSKFLGISSNTFHDILMSGTFVGMLIVVTLILIYILILGIAVCQNNNNERRRNNQNR